MTLTVEPSPATRTTSTCGSGVCGARLVGDLLAELVGAVAGGLDPAGVGDEDLAGLVDLRPPRARSPSGRRRRGARCRRSPRPAPRACRRGGSVSGETGAALTKSEPNPERLDRARGRGDRRRDVDEMHVVAGHVGAALDLADAGAGARQHAARRAPPPGGARATPRVFAIRAACIDCPTASVSAFAGRLLRRS